MRVRALRVQTVRLQKVMADGQKSVGSDVAQHARVSSAAALDEGIAERDKLRRVEVEAIFSAETISVLRVVEARLRLERGINLLRLS